MISQKAYTARLLVNLSHFLSQASHPDDPPKTSCRTAITSPNLRKMRSHFPIKKNAIAQLPTESILRAKATSMRSKSISESLSTAQLA